MNPAARQFPPFGRRPLLTAVLIFLCLVSLSPQARAEKSRLVVKGSTTILPVALGIADQFGQRYKNVAVETGGGGSVEGIRALIMGQADIATSSTFISEQEIQLAREHNVYPVPFRIGYDGILPVVNRANPLKNLTREQLKDIYGGRIDNWKQLGGPDLAIEVVSRDRSSGTYKVWRQIVLYRETVTTDLPLKHSSSDVIETVAQTRGAIGYVGLGYLNAQVKPLKVDGIMGSTRSVRNGSYPISRPLFMFTNGWPRGKTLDYINFVLHPEYGQSMIEEAEYIPLH